MGIWICAHIGVVYGCTYIYICIYSRKGFGLQHGIYLHVANHCSYVYSNLHIHIKISLSVDLLVRLHLYYNLVSCLIMYMYTCTRDRHLI